MTFAHMDPANPQRYLANAHSFVKGSPDPSDVFIQPALTDISVAFMLKPGALVANQLCPSLPVKVQAAKYPVFPRGYFFRDEMQTRADGGESVGGGFSVDWSNGYNADVWAWHTDMGPQARANAIAVDLDRAATNICTQKALIRREALFLSKFFIPTPWTTQVVNATSGVAGVNLTWKDSAALPIKQIRTMMRSMQTAASGYMPNKATFSPDAWDLFREHPNVLNRINAGQTPGGPADVTTQMAAGWLGLDQVLVAESVKTTSAENKSTVGAGDTFGYIANTGQVLLTYTPAAPSMMEPSAFYFFDWVADGLVGSFGNAISRWFIQERKALRYEIEMATDAKLISADCGAMMSAVNA